MTKIRLEVYDGAGGTCITDLSIFEIDAIDSKIGISENKIHYDTYEHNEYTSTDLETIKKLISYRSIGLFEYIISDYIFGDNKTNDYCIKKLLSSEFQDKHPELFI